MSDWFGWMAIPKGDHPGTRISTTTEKGGIPRPLFFLCSGNQNQGHLKKHYIDMVGRINPNPSLR